MKNLNWLLDGRPKTENLFLPLKVKIYILHGRFIKGFLPVNQPILVKQNGMVRYSVHNHPSGKSELSKHLHQNINHVFTWTVICSARKCHRTGKNLEVFYV